jgi:glutathione peroxidase
MSTKIDVNGPDAHPLFKYLVSQADFDEVPWNFTKFLIDDQFRSMGPQTTPEQIDGFIAQILS